MDLRATLELLVYSLRFAGVSRVTFESGIARATSPYQAESHDDID